MKVCDLALYSPSTSSGVKTHIANKIQYVESRPGIEHVVIVPGETERVESQGRSKVMTVRGVPTFYPGIRIALNIRRIAKILAVESPDIVELNCQYTLGWAAFLARKKRSMPVVGVYHTDVPACAKHWARPAGKALASGLERIVEFYEGLIYRHCNLTVILNSSMADRVARLGVHSYKCLPCAVDVHTFHPSQRDPAFRQQLGLASANQKTILYAGRLSAEKELDVLFRAYERLSPQEFALVIAGDGPLASDVTRRAATQPGVHYLGHVEDRAALARIYASADLFVTPGRYETFGMSTLEALACGLPVIGIRESGSAMLVTPEIGKLVGAGDAGELAAAITDMATWPAERTRAACHAFARRFSTDNVFDEYFGIYRELIDRARAA